jgi:hypothetical protein
MANGVDVLLHTVLAIDGGALKRRGSGASWL